MERRFFLSKRVLFWLNLGFWFVLIVIRLLQYTYYSMRSGEDIDWNERIIWLSADFISIWLLSFVIYALYLRTRGFKLAKFLGVHFVLSILIGFINLVISLSLTILGMRIYRTPEYTFFKALQLNLENFLTFTVNGFLMYWVLLIILFALNHYALFREQQLRSAQLQSQLSRVQLQTLKMQLQPHFLFNALNTISMMVRTQKSSSAVKMISGLGDLLRQSLLQEDEQFTTLEKEIELTQKYLAIEEVRFKDTLQVAIDIAPETRFARFPSLLLQPILENAFKHGIAHQMEEAVLRISSRTEGEELQVEIFNTGPLLTPGWEESSTAGIGLRNTRARLAQLYEDQFRFEVKNEGQLGVVVQINIPFEKGTA